MDKGPKLEVGLYSQASHGQGGHMDTATGRFYSDSGGLFMVTGTFHVKTEVLVVPGETLYLKLSKVWIQPDSRSKTKLRMYHNFDCRSQKETEEEVI